MLTEIANPSLLQPDVSSSLPTAQPEALDVSSSYNGSNVIFRLLRLESWGPALLNLGLLRFNGLLGFLNLFANYEQAQQRLVARTLGLLEVGRRHRVLDIACGRGKSSFMTHCMYPDSRVVGIDLLDCHVQVAQTLFDHAPNLHYQVGDAQDLDFADESFDRVMCIEAAFHFPNRAEFLREAYRVLRPNGRLVVVDFAWNSEADRLHRDDPELRIVRDVWQWNDFFSVDEYRQTAMKSGFRVTTHQDWSSRVTHPMQKSLQCLSFLGNNPTGRKFLEWKNPLYRSFSKDDWKAVARITNAHRCAQQRSKYMAFVFDKSEIS